MSGPVSSYEISRSPGTRYLRDKAAANQQAKPQATAAPAAPSPATRFLQQVARTKPVQPQAVPGTLTDMVAAAPHAAAIAGQAPLLVPAIVGFGGWGGSGKDTTAEILVRDYGHRLLSFGTYVADLLVEINPLVEVAPGRTERAATLMDRLGYEGAKKIPDFLRMLQDLGTGINHRDPGLWARLVLADLPPEGRGVITGIRSVEQVDAIRHVGGLAIWVSRTAVQPRNGHENELSVGPEDFDVVLKNDGTLSDLARNLRKVLAEAR